MVTTTSLAGTGLGISQKIANKLGTNIEFKSTEGNGSTFWFVLKLDKSKLEEKEWEDSMSIKLKSKRLDKLPLEVRHSSVQPLNSARSRIKETDALLERNTQKIDDISSYVAHDKNHRYESIKNTPLV